MGLGAAVVYTGVAVFAYHQSLFAPTNSLVGCVCGDQAQEVWFLRWPLYAVTHGHNPFFTNWMDFPQGVNLAINTTAPLLAILSAPLQLTIGSVATYDVLMVVAFAGSALAMCLALRRWVRSWGAAFAGGLLYGFSPYMMGQGIGHLFLVAAFIPPIVLVVLHEIVVVQRHPAWLDGLGLGLLLVAQYYISPEVLGMTVIVAACGLALVALARPHEVPSHVRHVAKTALFTALVGAAALAYPVWVTLAGPQHVVGPPHPLAGLALYPGDLLGPVLPTSRQLLAPAVATVHGDALAGTNSSENGMYLGIPLIAVLAVCAWVFRRSRTLLFFVAMTVVCFVLALGSHLTVDTRRTGVPLPYVVVSHIPFLQDILAIRFSLFLQLFAAASLAVGIDLVAARLRAPRDDARSAARWTAPVATAVLALVALVPLVPHLTYPTASTGEPAFYQSPAADRIPTGSTVLAYPYPLVPDGEWNLVYQVDTDMRFKLIGGDAFVPGPGGRSVTVPTAVHPAVVERIFTDAYTPTVAHEILQTTTATPPVDRSTVAALRAFLARYRVSSVLVDDLGAHPATVVRYVTRALGPPTRVGGVWGWFGVQRLLRTPGAR
jgi:hypothetical protein